MIRAGNTAIVTLCNKGLATSRKISLGIAGSRIHVHKTVTIPIEEEQLFKEVISLTKALWDKTDNLVFVLPSGVAVRAIAPLIKSKLKDPAVVVVDVGGRWAISLLSGHEGKANDLALFISNILDAEPVITTTSEAQKSLVVGVGCRHSIQCEDIINAISQTFAKYHLDMTQIRLLASVDIKKNEKGLMEASQMMNVPIRFISSSQIKECPKEFGHCAFVQEKVGVPGVAEPAALLAGRRTSLLVSKQKYQAVTVAVAKENCSW